jgi:hypothetical protein
MGRKKLILGCLEYLLKNGNAEIMQLLCERKAEKITLAVE